MIAVALAALSGLSYGAADFAGAFASRNHKATLVTAVGQVVSLLALLVAVFFWVGGTATTADYVWGAIGGLGAALGLVMFYRALAQGPMATAASLTALWGAGIPVVTGLALGDIPGWLQLLGIAVAVPAAVLVSVGGLSLDLLATNTTPRERVAGLANAANTKVLAVVAGGGFGLFFVALSRTGEEAGLYPLVGARVASILALTVVISVNRDWTPMDRSIAPVVVLTGLLDFAANAFYLTALKYGSFTWVAAISSLYPVATVLLARTILHERLARPQIAGLAMAGVALTCVAVGA